MPNGDGSATEIQWLIEERRRRMEDIREQIASTSDREMLTGLNGMLKMLEAEISDLEEELEAMDSGEDFEESITSIDRKIADINSQMELEHDPVIRNNLEVSKRYLQMERNGLLIRQTQTVKRKDPQEERIEELEQLCESRLRLINDLQKRLDASEKDLSYYRSLAEHPEKNVSCNKSRVTVTAEALASIRNEAKVLSVENYKLKTENRNLKTKLDTQSRNIQELARHCRESDSQIRILEQRVQQLRKEQEDRQ